MTTQHTPVFIDADNTFGVPGCDIDDGLALLYALGVPHIDIVGIACSHGNASQEVVHQNTLAFMKQIGRTDIPVYRGATHPLLSSSATSDQICSIPAVQALIDASHQYCGSLKLLATGSLTNLAYATMLDPLLFTRINAIALMGGVVEPLIINGKRLDELNFSCDALSAHHVLQSCKHTHLILAHAQSCLASLITLTNSAFKQASPMLTPVHHFILEHGQAWASLHQKIWDMPDIIAWDLLAAVALLNPKDAGVALESFTIDLCPTLLSDGYVLRHPSVPLEEDELLHQTVYVPAIKDHARYVQSVHDAWSNAHVQLALHHQ